MKKKEVIIVICILLIGFIGFGVYYFMHEDAVYAEVIYHNPVTQKEEVLQRFNVNEDAYYEFEVPNGKFHVEVNDGQYRAIDVDCPNQNCVDIGWVPSLGYYAPIICIPNGIIIQVVE